MRKFSTFIFCLFLFSFSFTIYAEDLDDKLDLVDILTRSIKAYPFPCECKEDTKNSGNILENYYVCTVQLALNPKAYSEELNDKLIIVRLCESGKENFNVEAWENYKKEILAKCKASYSSVKVERDDDQSIVSIADPQGQYAPIVFGERSFETGVDLTLSRGVQDKLLKLKNDETGYNFSLINVRTEYCFLGGEKLPIAIIKNGAINFLDDLITDDTRIYDTEYNKMIAKIYFSFSEISSGYSN